MRVLNNHIYRRSDDSRVLTYSGIFHHQVAEPYFKSFIARSVTTILLMVITGHSRVTEHLSLSRDFKRKLVSILF